MAKAATSLAESVYYSLKNKILRGEMRPGTALLEADLSDTLQVSRTPLRKALTQLTVEGYLEKGKDRTLRIPRISKEELKETLFTRKLLETASAEQAAINATESDISRIEHLVWEEDEALKTRDSLMISSVDRMFHNYIAKTSGNKILEEFVGQLGYKISLYLALSNTLGDIISEAIKEHALILNGIKLKMPDRAAKAMREHLDNVERRMFESISKAEASNAAAVPIPGKKMRKKNIRRGGTDGN
ncbi:MAG: GntR family transcriptional regulator [Synergistaceae bacterium]